MLQRRTTGQDPGGGDRARERRVGSAFASVAATLLIVCLWFGATQPLLAEPAGSKPVAGGVARGEPIDAVERIAAELQRRDERQLCGMAAGHALLAHRDTFDRMHGRLDAFGDWVFGWMSSLMASYELFGLGISEAIDWSRDGDGSMQDAVDLAWAGYIDERFEAIVVAPAMRGSTLGVTAADPSTMIVRKLRERELEQARARATRIEALLPRSSDAAAGLMEIYATPRPSREETVAVPGGAPGPHLIDGQVDMILLRSLRPYGSRLVGLTLRSGVVEVVAAAALVQAYDVMGNMVSGAVGLVVSGAVGAALAGGFDYTTNRIHAWLGRDAFIEDLAAHLDEAEARAAEATYEDVVAALGRSTSCPASLAEARARAPMLAFIEPRR